MDTDLPISHLSMGWLEIFILLGAIFLVVFGLFLWVMFIRKSKRRRRKYHGDRGNYREKLEKGASDIKELVDQKARRRKHYRYHQNPTLADTGGLPPRRDPDVPPPPP